MGKDTTSRDGRCAEGAGARRGGPLKGDELKVLPADRLVDAAYKILRKQFNRMQRNEPGARIGTDPKYLHDMRVATRRLRAALKVLARGLPEGGIKDSARDLNWIGGALGRVRDLDVHLLNLEEIFREVPLEHGTALAAYVEELRAAREEARVSMLRALDTKRYAAFTGRFGGLLAEGPPQTPDAPDAVLPAGIGGGSVILGELNRVLKKGRALGPSAGDAELHKLRIRCKRLRYSCEFFEDVYGRPARVFAKQVTRLQDILGEHHDAVVARESLARYAERIGAKAESGARTYVAVGELTAIDAGRAERSRREFTEAWDKFDRSEMRAPLEARIKKVADRARADRG